MRTITSNHLRVWQEIAVVANMRLAVTGIMTEPSSPALLLRQQLGCGAVRHHDMDMVPDVLDQHPVDTPRFDADIA